MPTTTPGAAPLATPLDAELTLMHHGIDRASATFTHPGDVPSEWYDCVANGGGWTVSVACEHPALDGREIDTEDGLYRWCDTWRQIIDGTYDAGAVAA